MSIGIGLGLSPVFRQNSLSLLQQVQALYQDGSVDGVMLPILPEYVFEERTGASATTPASVDGVVGTIKSPVNGYYAIATSDAARGVLRTDGTYYWLETDGTNTEYRVTTLVMSQPITYFQAAKSDSLGSNYLFDGVSVRNAYWGVDGSGGRIDFYAGLIPTDLDNSRSTDNFISQALFNGASSTHKYNGVFGTLSGSTGTFGINNWHIGSRLNGTDVWNGRIYSINCINKILTTDESDLVDQYLASICPVTL